MKGLTTLLLFVTTFVASSAKVTRLAPTSRAAASQQTRFATDSYERGRRTFANGCAKCHDEDAAKKLPDGTSLVQRLAESKDPEALAGTRLKKMNEEDRRAVWEYLNVLVKRYRSSRPNTNEAKSSVPSG